MEQPMIKKVVITFGLSPYLQPYFVSFCCSHMCQVAKSHELAQIPLIELFPSLIPTSKAF